MLKQRLIFGVLFSALFVVLIALDSWMSRAWPGDAVGWSTPPGFFVALVSVIVIPMGIAEMRGLLKKENVTISLRITVVAAVLCMLWPWVEQVAERVVQEQANSEVMHVAPGSAPIAVGSVNGVDSRPPIESTMWYKVGKWFRSVKPHYLVPTVLAMSLVAAFVRHSRNQRVDGAMANAGGTLLAIVYLGVLPGFFLPICMTHSAWMVLATVAVVKSADIGAYTTGHLIGRHKLIAWLSPGKTIEGFVGGTVLAGIVGVGVAALFLRHGGTRWEHVPMSAALIGGGISGAVLGVVGQMGDLLESLLKRDAGVKDSGAVPGFGGVLDILDSPLLAAPVAYWLLKIALPTGGGA